MEMYKTRSGTVDSGKDYERLIVADLILKAIGDNTVEDFHVSANNADLGEFDDVVMELELANQNRQRYALRLNHVNKNKLLTKNNLTAAKGNFSMNRIFAGFKKLKVQTHLNFVLFTNCKFDANDNGEIIIVDGGLKIKILKIPYNPLLNTSNEGRCYKFEVDKDQVITASTEVDKYRTFLEKFYLYTNQANVADIRTDISKSFEKMFCCHENIFEQYLGFITKWSNRVGKQFKLDKSLMRHTIAISLLLPFIEPFSFSERTINDQFQHSQLFKEAISKFNVTILEKENCHVIKRVYENIKSEIQDISKINQIGRIYQMISEYITDLNNLNDETMTILLWLLRKCPLIVTENETTLKAIDLSEIGNFVVLNTDSSRVNLENFKTFRNLSDLDVDSEIGKRILDSFQLSLQGKEKISLQSFTKNCQELKNIITTNELVGMLDDSFTIGGKREVLPIVHIDRLVSNHIINYQFLNTVETDTLVVISCQGKFDTVKRHITAFNIIIIKEYLKKQEPNVNNSTSSSRKFKKNIYVSRDVCSASEFDEVCNKNLHIKKYHYFRIVDDGSLEWVKSKGDITELNKFRRSGHFVEENKLFCFNTDNMMMAPHIEIVCADAGMGKSTLAKNIKNHLSSTVWTVLIYVNDYASYFNENNYEIDDFINYIVEKTYKNTTPFDLKLLNILKKHRRITFIWDGLDELFNETLQDVMAIIDELSEKGFKQLLTSRNNLRDTLENRYKVFSRTIKPFDEEQQNNYIKQRLTLFKTDSEVIILKIKKNIEMARYNDILGIPLQVSMLTELFRQDFAKYTNLLDETFSIADLYDHFVDEKLNIYYKEKLGLSEITPAAKRVLQNEKIHQLQKYEKCVLKVFFTNEVLEGLNVSCETYLDEIWKEGDRFGIITGVTRHGKPSFLHHSYGEYFAATYLYKNHNKIPKLKEIIFDKKYRNIRYLFDLMLAKDCPMHIAVICQDFNALLNDEEQLRRKDDGGRSVLHLACSWGQQYELLNIEKYGIFKKKYVIDDRNENSTKENLEYQQTLKLLSMICDPYETDQLFKENSFWYADRSLCLLPIITLSNKYKVNFNQFKNFNDIFTVLYYAVKFDYSEVFDIIKNIPFIETKRKGYSLLDLSAKYNAKRCLEKILSKKLFTSKINDGDQCGSSPILMACEKGHTEIVQILIDHNADVNLADKFGQTPIYCACQNGHTEIVQILIDHNADVNLADKFVQTPMYWACQNGHAEIVLILVNHNADVNLADKDGQTPMYRACRNGHAEIVQILINHNADVNLANKDGRTPMYRACRNGHTKIVQILIDHNADVNLADKDGQTPIYWACRNGHTEIVQILVNHNADVNLADKDGQTPIYWACRNGHTEIVQILVNHNADVNLADKDGQTPIYCACQNGHTEIVQILTNHNADVNLADKDGQTPIYWACQHGHTVIVQILIKHNADVNLVDKDGHTPMYWANRNRHDEIVQILVNHKAAVNLADKSGKTPTPYYNANINSVNVDST